MDLATMQGFLLIVSICVVFYVLNNLNNMNKQSNNESYREEVIQMYNFISYTDNLTTVNNKLKDLVGVGNYTFLGTYEDGSTQHKWDLNWYSPMDESDVDYDSSNIPFQRGYIIIIFDKNGYFLGKNAFGLRGTMRVFSNCA